MDRLFSLFLFTAFLYHLISLDHARHQARESVLVRTSSSVGDKIQLGRGPSWPVAAIESNRALVLDMRSMSDFDWVWQFGICTVDENRTRLVSRSCVRTRTAWSRLFTHVIEPAGFLMTRRMLLDLKHRAETLRAQTLARAA